MSAGEMNSLANRPSWVLWLTSGILTIHVAAVLHTLVPDWGLVARFKSLAPPKVDPPTPAERAYVAELNKNAAAFPPRRPLDSWFLNYRILTGTRQDWQMFHLAPRDRDLEVALEARDSAGKVHQLGPVLPGFEEVDLFDTGRSYPLWGRFEFWNEGAYVESYLENVGNVLKQSEEPIYKDVTLIYRKHVIQPPDEIVSSGKVSEVSKKEWWLPRDAW